MTCGRQFQVKRSPDDKLLLALKIDLITSRAFERVARHEREARSSYHTRPENHANDFEKVYFKD